MSRWHRAGVRGVDQSWSRARWGAARSRACDPRSASSSHPPGSQWLGSGHFDQAADCRRPRRPLNGQVVGQLHRQPLPGGAHPGASSRTARFGLTRACSCRTLLNATREIPSRDAASPTPRPRSASTSSRRTAPGCTGFLIATILISSISGVSLVIGRCPGYSAWTCRGQRGRSSSARSSNSPTPTWPRWRSDWEWCW